MSDVTPRLAEIRLRADLATQGPWIVDPDEPTGVMHPDKPDGFDGTMIAYLVDHDAGMFPREHNGAFIAHARQDVPQLVAALEAVVGLHRSRVVYANETHCPQRLGTHDAVRHVEDGRTGFWVCLDMPLTDECQICTDDQGAAADWPCPTVQAITAALNPETKEAS